MLFEETFLIFFSYICNSHDFHIVFYCYLCKRGIPGRILCNLNSKIKHKLLNTALGIYLDFKYRPQIHRCFFLEKAQLWLTVQNMIDKVELGNDTQRQTQKPVSTDLIFYHAFFSFNSHIALKKSIYETAFANFKSFYSKIFVIQV